MGFRDRSQATTGKMFDSSMGLEDRYRRHFTPPSSERYHGSTTSAFGMLVNCRHGKLEAVFRDDQGDSSGNLSGTLCRWFMGEASE